MDITPEFIAQYERKIRNGFPSGELQFELQQQGFSEQEISAMLAEIKSTQPVKNASRNKSFRVAVSIALMISGLLMVAITKSNLGYFFAISGLIKIGFDIFGESDLPG